MEMCGCWDGTLGFRWRRVLGCDVKGTGGPSATPWVHAASKMWQETHVGDSRGNATLGRRWIQSLGL